MPFDLSQPALLETVSIPKPWGQEVWYTGMETRGESHVRQGEMALPLSSYLSLDAAATCNHADVLLLKILDPSPTPVLGDLYFEVHAEKREVYIVTHVDRDAWPSGRGAIRFGMNQQKRAQFADDEQFRKAYLQAVQAYESVRRAIDEEDGNPALATEERRRREEMEGFTALEPLAIGDVVAVPPWTPHALQHGVRVVEFQTQTYERLIVSFAQKVLTQDHWDTAEAVRRMHLDTPSQPEPSTLCPGIERIAEFDHFNVWRTGAAAGPFKLDAKLPYAVLMAIGSWVEVGALRLEPEQACFIPHAALANTMIEVADHAHGLVAAPGL